METDIYCRVALRQGVVGGQWPLQIQGHKHLKVIHRIYGMVISLFFVSFVCTQHLDILVRLDESFFDLVNNLAVSLLYTITIVKCLALRTQLFSRLVKQVRTIEKIVVDCDDEEIKAIQVYHVKWCNKWCTGIMTISCLTLVPYFLTPIFAIIADPAMRKNELERPLPFNTVQPFDRRKYYWIHYLVHVMGGTMGSITTGCSDSFYWTLIIFAIAQLKTLQHKLANLHVHAQLFVDEGSMSKEDAIKLCARKCYLLHQMIIKFVAELDTGMKYVMLVDFLGCSLQISTVGFEGIIIDSKFEKFWMMEFLIGVLGQLFCFYWCANELIHESLSVSTSIWKGEISEYPQSVQKDLAFMMLRAQEPLTLNVGPFYAMSTSTLITIVRVSYSYVALLYQFYSEN